MKDAHDIPPLYAAAREHHLAGRHAQALDGYLKALSVTPEDPFLLFFLGTLYMNMGQNGLATVLLTRCLQLQPRFPEAFNNLGSALKSLGYLAEAEAAFRQGVTLNPQDADIYNNLASLKINADAAEEAVRWAEQALAVNPEHPQANWNKALGLLEQGKWGAGWDLYKWGYRTSGRQNRQYDAPVWDGHPVDTLVLYGEQGIGDELMFAELVRDVLLRRLVRKTLIIDAHPRLVPLFKRAFDRPAIAGVSRPAVEVHGTRKSSEIEWYWKHWGAVDAKAAMADLCRLYRRTEADFPRKPYLNFDQGIWKQVKGWLDNFGPHPKIGIAWQGGSPKTNINDRSIPPPLLKPIFEAGRKRCDFISLQYGADAKRIVDLIDAEMGTALIHRQDFIDDFDALTHLAAAVDLVITVDQTLVHQCGAVGAKCLVLTPKKCSWRYAPYSKGGHLMTWWGDHVQLRRQHTAGEWGNVIEGAALYLDSFLSNPRVAALGD